MNLYFIKFLGISMVIMCCIIATYTDVKSQIIPNKLTITVIFVGISLVSLYYYQFGDFNVYYYLSILIVYIFSYFLWRLGVWAGGDVKLFTALSTLMIPEFLDIIPHFELMGMVFPLALASLKIPTLFVMFNSVLSILPIILMYISFKIIKDKLHLMIKFKQSFNIKEVFISLNSLTLAYIIISLINIHQVILKIVILLFLSYLLSRIMKSERMIIIVTLMIILQQSITGNIITLFEEFIMLSLILAVKNVYHNGIIKDVLTDEIEVFNLEEGMILQYPLYFKDNHYYFDKDPWYHVTKEKGELICSNRSHGISNDDIELLKKVCKDSKIYIKKGLPFAPFILSGLLTTLIFGNTFQLISMFLGMI